MKKFKISLVIAAISAISLTSYGKQLNYCLGANPEGFNPYQSTAASSLLPIMQIYDRLLYLNIKTDKIEPMLVESWEISKDGLVYTLHLRKNVQFQSNKVFKPTRPFNAQDVIFSIDSQINKTSKYNKPGNDVWSSVVSWEKYIKSVKAIDDYTVEITLSQPKATFLVEMTMYQAIIQSKEYADAMLAKGDLSMMDREPIGTGAYQFVDFRQDDYVHLTAFKNYWGGVPSIERANILVVQDPSVLLDKMQKDECDTTLEVSGQSVMNIHDSQSDGKAKNIFISPKPGFGVYGLGLNYKHGILQNVKVREAIAYAINYDKIVKDAYNGMAVHSASVIPRAIPGYDSTMKPRPYDVAKAKQLIKESGVDVSKQTLEFYIRADKPEARILGEIIQANLKDIGIDLKVVSVELGTFVKDAYHAGKADMTDMRWGADIPDASNFLDTQYTCSLVGTNSPTQYCNKDFDALSKKGMLETDQNKRNGYFAEQQRMLVNKDIIYIPVVEPQAYQIGNSDTLTQDTLDSIAYTSLFKDYKLK